MTGRGRPCRSPFPAQWSWGPTRKETLCPDPHARHHAGGAERHALEPGQHQLSFLQTGFPSVWDTLSQKHLLSVAGIVNLLLHVTFRMQPQCGLLPNPALLSDIPTDLAEAQGQTPRPPGSATKGAHTLTRGNWCPGAGPLPPQPGRTQPS